MSKQQNSEEPDEKPKPKLKREPERAGSGSSGGSGSGSGSGRPPRPTAVGLGGSDDEFDSGKWRSSTSDSPDGGILDWNRVQSIPMEGLRFVQLDSYPRPGSLDVDGKTGNAHPVKMWRDESKLANWISRSQAKLDELHKRQASIAYFVHGSRTGCTEYFGASIGASAEEDGFVEQLLRELVRRGVVEAKGEPVATAELIDSEEIQALIEEDCSYSEILTGLPTGIAYRAGVGQNSADEAADDSAYGTFWIAMAGLLGHRYGILALAKPYSERARRAEALALIRSIEAASLNEDPDKKRMLKYYLDRQRYYLKMFQPGETEALWSVSCYVFCREASVSLRLSSLLRYGFTDPNKRIVIPEAKKNAELEQSILQFGLIQERVDTPNPRAYRDYPFLTPLTSQALTTYFPICAE